MTAAEIIQKLNLRPHPAEGGFFAETYRAAEQIPAAALPVCYGGPRSHNTAIYYLLSPETFSEMHRLAGDEIFHFYLGDPVEMLQLREDGSGERVLLGSDLAGGMAPQLVVPRRTWQGSRLVPGGKVALLGTTVAPGFEFQDYTRAERAVLLRQYPTFQTLIVSLTRG
jgi:predicted cupin superfamily sugar epimerase